MSVWCQSSGLSPLFFNLRTRLNKEVLPEEQRAFKEARLFRRAGVARLNRAVRVKEERIVTILLG
jgi:hypothetical protein